MLANGIAKPLLPILLQVGKVDGASSIIQSSAHSLCQLCDIDAAT